MERDVFVAQDASVGLRGVLRSDIRCVQRGDGARIVPPSPTPGGLLTPLTLYAECLERVRSVLVFFSTSGKVNAAVLAELESEVRATVSSAHTAMLPVADVEADLDRIAIMTLPEVAAATASRAMRRWIVAASERLGTASPSRPPGNEARP